MRSSEPEECSEQGIRRAPLCQSIAVATRQHLGQDSGNTRQCHRALPDNILKVQQYRAGSTCVMAFTKDVRRRSAENAMTKAWRANPRCSRLSIA